MSEIHTTLTGNVVSAPRATVSATGVARTSIRVGVTPRWQDKESGEWRDGQSSFVNVVCWRALAENVAASVAKGDPVVVAGRVRVTSFTGSDQQRRQAVEIHAVSVGHDLSRGRSSFGRRERGSGTGSGPAAGPLVGPQVESGGSARSSAA